MKEARVTLLLVVGWIIAVTGMAFAAAFAILYLLGGFWPAAAAAAMFLPFLGLLFFVERLGGRKGNA